MSIEELREFIQKAIDNQKALGIKLGSYESCGATYRVDKSSDEKAVCLMGMIYLETGIDFYYGFDNDNRTPTELLTEKLGVERVELFRIESGFENWRDSETETDLLVRLGASFRDQIDATATKRYPIEV